MQPYRRPKFVEVAEYLLGSIESETDRREQIERITAALASSFWLGRQHSAMIGEDAANLLLLPEGLCDHLYHEMTAGIPVRNDAYTAAYGAMLDGCVEPPEDPTKLPDVELKAFACLQCDRPEREEYPLSFSKDR
jgi:hypothetical protein